VTACRVLELGCGDGGNLVPMAYGLPSSRFVGVDLSRRAVERAADVIAALGLQNAEVRCADFAAHAERHGLRYLAEADFFEMTVPAELASAFAELDDPIEREQYLDFFKGRLFRQTLLCHAETEVEEPGPARVAGMLAASPAQPDGDPEAGRVTFRGPKGASLTTDEPLAKAAMLALGAAWPDAVPVSELGDGEALQSLLLQAYAANLVQLHVWTPALATTPSARPRASALARLQATEGSRITNLRHATLEVTDDLGRHLIRLLDGTRDRPALLRELDRPPDELERSLDGLAAAALLEA
jgi:methyltransferase-like protein